ncbi:MAG: glycoside hydrolase family 13 protein [Chloroherpetonaceae bacterium]|nr:glycoside hydrolase family 13 protein [Chloroherpetonaceae bacterium]MCS7212270.1 glycoside hydrolase family 13 protein [Chloroherpetonaceae bacterium]MDW8020273.1 glycoside hydrolase family 13 protein [Chloroherpetonaceae bacterium]
MRYAPLILSFFFSHILLAQMKPTSSFAPNWARGAVFYQIFPERFRNGDPHNDPTFDKSAPTGKAHSWTSNWYALTSEEKAHSPNFYDNVFRRRYGGDLQGVLDKLDYLADLGIEVIYFNPLFEAPSLHKYDATLLHHIDINFGPDPAGDLEIISKENPADPNTWQWTSADRLFLKLVEEAHRRGIRIILDGVFNHTGRTFWAFQDVLRHQEKSRYKDWYHIISWDDSTKGTKFDYAGWHGSKSLPIFARDSLSGLHPEVCAYLFAITKRWMLPDGKVEKGIDGWRLDAADDVPHQFWKMWRQYAKSLNPNAYLVGEIWKNAREWLQGDEFDAVTNYQLAILTFQFFIKRSIPSSRDFLKKLEALLAAYPQEANYGLLNLLESHDTDRLASMIVNPNRDYDRQSSLRYHPEYDPRKPNETERALQKAITVFQMTYLGSPMLYYGTEAGMWGADDPDDRKPMLWPDLRYENETHLYRPDISYTVEFDQSLFEFHKKLISIRRQSKAIRYGTFRPIYLKANLVCYERKYEDELVVVIINPLQTTQSEKLLLPAGVWRDELSGKTFIVSKTSSSLSLSLSGYSGMILKRV